MQVEGVRHTFQALAPLGWRIRSPPQQYGEQQPARFGTVRPRPSWAPLRRHVGVAVAAEVV